MHNGDSLSIFSEYYKAQPLVDRFEADCAHAVDVIIPIIHTNEMWRANLLSIYREVPVNRLILGDGGCIDDTLDVARQFPRVEVLDHRGFTSLGFSIRHLIESVKTEWFIYLHSDVYLPPGWFDSMSAHRGDYDWFECNQRITVMADYPLDTTKVDRSYSGSQMGRKAAFERVTPLIDDDFLYRNEDIIIAKLLQRTGGRYGKVGDTHHFHQIMYKPSRWHRKVKRVAIDLELGRDEEIRANRTYAEGIIKYLDPSEVMEDRHSVRVAVDRLIELEDTSNEDFLAWVKTTNPKWLSVLGYAGPATSETGAVAAAPAAPAVKATPIPSSRARVANRIHQIAEIYGAHGLGHLLVRTVRLVLRALRALIVPQRT